ncbi:hypothetical protein HDV06_001783 [Boothiomyces sp. JEL0866]|nr:hypothetical protein HDV06_001783 [Boothiomyces sp. JEL0866]
MTKDYQDLTQEEWEERERKRKSNHTAIERKRRIKINEQIQQLKSLIPPDHISDDTEKVAILQDTAKYIRQIQDILLQYYNKDPNLYPEVSSLLPTKASTTHSVLLTLLPSYRPPSEFKPVVPLSKDSKEQSNSMDVENLLSK